MSPLFCQTCVLTKIWESINVEIYLDATCAQLHRHRKTNTRTCARVNCQYRSFFTVSRLFIGVRLFVMCDWMFMEESNRREAQVEIEAKARSHLKTTAADPKEVPETKESSEEPNACVREHRSTCHSRGAGGVSQEGVAGSCSRVAGRVPRFDGRVPGTGKVPQSARSEEGEVWIQLGRRKRPRGIDMERRCCSRSTRYVTMARKTRSSAMARARRTRCASRATSRGSSVATEGEYR